jgi:magnesium chelatase family protein
MLAKLNTFALQGIDAVDVVAEVDVSVGLPKTVLVGLPEAAVRESVHRIERALVNLGYRRHPGRTVINLAPARFRRESPGAGPAGGLRRPTCEPAARAASPG